MSKIDSSGIRKVFDLAARLEDPINLSIGRPDFDVPEAVKESAIGAVRAGKNQYTLTQGIPELRSALREYLSTGKGIDLPLDSVLVTSGVSGGILLSFMALFGPGDEVIVPDPYFVMYKHLLSILGARPVYADTYPDFVLTPERVEPLITERTKAIIFSSPANPTGVVAGVDVVRGLVEVAERNGLLIISDEIYDSFVYDGPLLSPGSIHEKTLTLGGFSKSHAMTGWRVGYACGPKEIIGAMATLQQYTFVCAPAPFQWAAIEALGLGNDEKRAEYGKKRDRIVSALSTRFEITPPGGAFYIFPRAPGGAGSDFVERAIREKSLLVIPGEVFSEYKTHFRISYAAPDETIERGIEALLDLAGDYD